MCDFHLKGKCFHPEKVQKGLVAANCEVHQCQHCTNKPWQNKRISDEFNYYQSLIDLTATEQSIATTPLDADSPSAFFQKEPTPKKLFLGLF
jgi:hypothetical protein